MKTVAVISRHNVCNYGSILQAYATEHVLRGLGYEPITIDYRRQAENIDGLVARYADKKPLLYQIYRKYLWKRMHMYADRRFRAMQESYLTLSDPVDDRTIWDNLPNADIYLTGSDQVWNQLGDGVVDGAFFWSGLSSDKTKVSYAASFGKDTSTAEYDGQMQTWLRGYNAVSVREDSGVDICRRFGVDAEQVLDPTLLLDRDDWSRLGGVVPLMAITFSSTTCIGTRLLSNTLGKRRLGRALRLSAFARRSGDESDDMSLCRRSRSFWLCSSMLHAFTLTRFTARPSRLTSAHRSLLFFRARTLRAIALCCRCSSSKRGCTAGSRETLGTFPSTGSALTKNLIWSGVAA